MSLAGRIDKICGTLPGAEKSDPSNGDLDSWKLDGKMFACLAGGPDGVAVKCDSVETVEMLIDAGVGTKAPYFHKSWIRLPDGVNDGDLEHRIYASYDKIRSGLTKKKQAELPARPKMEG